MCTRQNYQDVMVSYFQTVLNNALLYLPKWVYTRVYQGEFTHAIYMDSKKVQNYI